MNPNSREKKKKGGEGRGGEGGEKLIPHGKNI